MARQSGAGGPLDVKSNKEGVASWFPGSWAPAKTSPGPRGMKGAIDSPEHSPSPAACPSRHLDSDLIIQANSRKPSAPSPPPLRENPHAPIHGRTTQLSPYDVGPAALRPGTLVGTRSIPRAAKTPIMHHTPHPQPSAGHRVADPDIPSWAGCAAVCFWSWFRFVTYIWTHILFHCFDLGPSLPLLDGLSD